MLQIRLSVPEFSSGVHFTDPIIFERADDISLIKETNSSNERISFKVAPNDPKQQYLNYLRWWECWDTDTNTRLNYGPIEEISGESGEDKTVSGPGRSAVLAEFIKSQQTFYYPIDMFFDDLRYENIAAEPRTSTIINTETDSEYYGLSKRSKDYVIDEQTGYIAVGRDTPARGTIKSDVYWSGIGKADWLTVDLGESYKISRVRVLLPWWGGVTVANNRSYDWSFSHSLDNVSYNTIYQTPIPNGGPNTGGAYRSDGVGPNRTGTPIELDAVSGRYWKLNITDTHAWVGNYWYPPLTDEYDWQCLGSDVRGGETYPSPTPPNSIPKTDLSPQSNCHASAVEIGVFREIIGVDDIPNLAYHQIQNDSRQITYFHAPEANEMITAGTGKKFEPGTFFRKLTFSSGGSTTVKDEYNSLIYEGGGATISCPAYSRLLVFSNATAQVAEVDTWKGILDAFSFGGSYAYSDKIGDYLVFGFRGVSLKWYATVPDTATAGIASIELRSRDDTTGVWSGWTVLNAGLTLPIGIAGEKIWEITFESGTLLPNTSYELRITNLNGGYVSLDAFAGYWHASFTEYNEDDARVGIFLPKQALQSYSQKFSRGSIYQFKAKGYTKMGLSFTGDRVIVYSRRGPGYGLMDLGLSRTVTPGEPPTGGQMFIPGGNANGTLTVDLNSTYNYPQAVVFDSSDYFTDPGLPWNNYRIHIYKPNDADPIWVDGIGVHETSGLSVKFITTNHLEMLKNTAEVLQLEWDINEIGVKLTPRLGTDTDVIFAEGRGTTIKIGNVEDSGEIATMLFASGADIDGLPLTTVVENKTTRALFGRTIQRPYDFRSTADYFTLIGASRTELLRRRTPQKRIAIQYVGDSLPVTNGDSFFVKTKDLNIRARAMTITRNQSANNGTSWLLECLEWPQIN